jgi:hypothetical protein
LTGRPNISFYFPTANAGLLLNGQFSPNYFSISQVEQHFDDFTEEFEKGEVMAVVSSGARAQLSLFCK